MNHWSMGQTDLDHDPNTVRLAQSYSRKGRPGPGPILRLMTLDHWTPWIAGDAASTATYMHSDWPSRVSTPTE